MPQLAILPVGKRAKTKVQNRTAILDAAREVFGEMGYEPCTVRDIIRRTGLAAGTFYNYFKSKEEVFAALADDGARRFGPILKAIRSQHADFGGFVRQALQAYFTFLADEHSSWAARRPPEEHLHVQGQTPEMEAVFNEVREAIVEEIARGGAPAADADYLAAACIAIAREVGDQMLNRRPVDVEGATAFSTALIMSGLKGLPQAQSKPEIEPR
ncbi:MAG: TetR/AcrR family transcriptional regulator [Phenylobacterium sp.]|uniref:TetR/AcrR family transcriptional regulator n=1 Tax=Phenylobacterium sp. TaxID=1871053 RepID=UPI00271C5855|nr:TetR/AcrR family transcriptional regulator [Phenylobacterium sp.]MDO8900713.1 TetR/AcrR family transcriptional regulator [Phenylobacterium sp.]MDP2215291.1 TetR/AcrR family transcriptional regulator [Phenylobacterium sp.]